MAAMRLVAAVVTGRVVTESSRPVANARVAVAARLRGGGRCIGTPWWTSASTDGQGRFVVLVESQALVNSACIGVRVTPRGALGAHDVPEAGVVDFRKKPRLDTLQMGRIILPDIGR